MAAEEKGGRARKVGGTMARGQLQDWRHYLRHKGGASRARPWDSMLLVSGPRTASSAARGREGGRWTTGERRGKGKGGRERYRERGRQAATTSKEGDRAKKDSGCACARASRTLDVTFAKAKAFKNTEQTKICRDTPTRNTGHLMISTTSTRLCIGSALSTYESMDLTHGAPAEEPSFRPSHPISSPCICICMWRL